MGKERFKRNFADPNQLVQTELGQSKGLVTQQLRRVMDVLEMLEAQYGSKNNIPPETFIPVYNAKEELERLISARKDKKRGGVKNGTNTRI